MPGEIAFLGELMAQEKKQSFMVGAAILTVSTLAVKILGLLFSMFLANFISTESMSYFYTAYDIFSVFLMLSTAGLPVAVSRMVGAAYAQGRKKEADRVFFVSFWLFFGIGLLGCLIMFFGADWISSTVMATPGAAPAVMALAPTMFFISVMSALRGYFQGRSNMTPTAVSQTIEAVAKVVIGVGLALYILQQYDSDEWAPVGAILGVSASAFLGTLYLALYKLRQSRKDRAVTWEAENISASSRELFLTLLKFSIPITLGSCFLSVLDMADSAVLMHRLQSAAGFSEETAYFMKGLLGHARKFFDLPGAFVIPISTSLLPVLSGAVASGDQDSVDHISSISLRVTFLISVPASVGMCLFAEPICGLLLPGNPEAAAGSAPLLSMLSVSIAFSCSLYTTNAILQAFGRPVMPVVNMAVGGAVKIALSYVLNGMPEVNVMGSAISTVASYFLIMALNFIAIRQSLPNMDSVVKTVLPILFSSAVMGVVSYGVYWGLCFFLPIRAAVLPAIAAAVLSYAVCVVACRAVTYDDVAMLPKGKTLARLLHVKKTVRPRHMRKK